jgi:hypothetical protein
VSKAINLRWNLELGVCFTVFSLYNKYMNEPNHQEQPTNKRLSPRATNFLMMGSSGTVGQVSQTGPIATEGEAAPIPEPPPPQAPEEQRPRTGVISSTIHPAQRPGNTPPPATGPISAPSEQTAPRGKTAPALTQEELEQKKEERIGQLADKIASVFETFHVIRTGMLDPSLSPSEKMHFISRRYPGFFERFGKILGVFVRQLEPILKLMQRVNQRLIERNVIQAKPATAQLNEAHTEDQAPPPPPEKISFLELAEKNIIFCDNRKRPLYSLEQLRGKHGYTASEEVIAPMIFEGIIQAFQEVAPKAKAIPTPQTGHYAGTPMDQVMENISEEEILVFLNYVKRFPRGYVGKNFRITESFAGWVVSGTPDD